MHLTNVFRSFFDSERAAGLILLFCTLISLVLANVGAAEWYHAIWQNRFLNEPVEFWINDALMTIFFLLVGLEIEREIYIGELASVKAAMLPVFAAAGGMIVPALIHFGFNNGTPSQSGFGIPMATDIAFSLGVLSLLGSKVPASLKIFLTALAIIDDLGAILVIAVFYSQQIVWIYLAAAGTLFGLMLVMNRAKVYAVGIYLIIGAGLWYCLFRAGIHPTISGVLIAFAIPFGNGGETSLSYSLQQTLHRLVAFIVLPLFVLANTALVIPSSFARDLLSLNSIGIIAGLVIGKPAGILLFSVFGQKTGLCELPEGLNRKHILGAGILAGIGFTMSVFITILAFNDRSLADISRIAILVASCVSGLGGYFFLKRMDEGTSRAVGEI